MMEERVLQRQIEAAYGLSVQSITLLRDSGCLAYRVDTADGAYFLRVTKPLFEKTTLDALSVQLYLLEQGFPVPPVIRTSDGAPYAQQKTDDGVCYEILYDWIDGEEVDPETDAEAIGTFVGDLHRVMQDYPGQLPEWDRAYMIDRYLNIMRRKNYPGVDAFAALGEELWARVDSLPRGYCHGDLYRGNLLKTTDGKYYLLDFDTFCRAFSQYDAALICNMTDYFTPEPDGFAKTRAVYERYLSTYTKVIPLSSAEQAAVYDLIAIYHFSLQATIIELFGLDCVDHAFFDRQYAWLVNWETQRNAAFKLPPELFPDSLV